MAIKPLTRDPSAMKREGYDEPERAFPPPPTAILEGNLDERAFDMLELIVWIWRISQHGSRLTKGIDWAVLQRWYAVGDSQEMRFRIYGAVFLLVTEGYLREGPGTAVPIHPGLTSDQFTPTAKAFDVVDRRQAPAWKKAWR